MGKIVSIFNQKGGVGKTTTAVNLAAGLGLAGKKVLLVDVDPQGNTTSGFGINKQKTLSSYEVLIGAASADNAIIATEYKNVSVIPSKSDLAGAEIELTELDRRESRLKTALLPLRERYDFIFIDCPPSLGILTTNALAARITTDVKSP
jgi:chromosome partitioning protein